MRPFRSGWAYFACFPPGISTHPSRSSLWTTLRRFNSIMQILYYASVSLSRVSGGQFRTRGDSQLDSLGLIRRHRGHRIASPGGHPMDGNLSASTLRQSGCQHRGRWSGLGTAMRSAIGFLDDRNGDTAAEYVRSRVTHSGRGVPALTGAVEGNVSSPDALVLGCPPGVLLYP